jgi:mRNA-degrading endonuclease RelE of RelBE toxin-antitoxin system
VKNIFEPEFEQYSEKLPPSLHKKIARAFDSLEGQDHLQFSRGLKHIHGPVYSLRVGNGYRALDYKAGDEMHWDWIGPHDEYERRPQQY